MKALFRLALTLTVAVVACLAPVASAQDDLGPLDGHWSSGDGGSADFYFTGQTWSLATFQWLWVYEGTHTHPGGGGQCNLKAWYYPSTQEVVFQYKMGSEKGGGVWVLGPGRNTLNGWWKSSVGNARGNWNLWR